MRKWFRGHEVKVLAETSDGDCIIEFCDHSECMDRWADDFIDPIRIIVNESSLERKNPEIPIRKTKSKELRAIESAIESRRSELNGFDAELERKRKKAKITELDNTIREKAAELSGLVKIETLVDISREITKQRKILKAINDEIKAVGATLNLPKDYDIEDLECVKQAMR